ncbi:hypothetical protein L6261_00005 [Candidatus Parcubacteria bacterium]|nr:hypothetical protein [Candidatus Parcubacteria bacterium]
MNKKDNEKEKDHYTAIILEEMRSDFKMFGEVLSGVNDKLEVVRKKGDATFEEVGKIKIEIGVIKEDIVEMKGDIVEMKGDIVEIKGDIVEINGRLTNIETEVKSLRKDFDFIREELKDKVSMSYFKQFEERLLRIEKKLELSST